jgi:hypothetical protein
MTGIGIIENISFGDDVTCRPHKPWVDELASFPATPGKLAELRLLELEP